MTNLPHTIPQEVLDRIDTLDELISQGKYPEGFSHRYKVFKEWIVMSGFDIHTALFVYLNRGVLDGINEWEGNHQLMQALEFEYRKEEETRRKALDEIMKTDALKEYNLRTRAIRRYY